MTDTRPPISKIDQELALVNERLKATQGAAPPAPSALPQWWSTTDAMTVSMAVLVFGLLTMMLATVLLKRGRDADALLRIFGTLMILVATLFLIVAGYSSTQIAPAMGLLGTVAGYLLGKTAQKKDSGPDVAVGPK